MSASGARRHDHRYRLAAAPSARRANLLLASHHCRPGASKRRSHPAKHAKITTTTAAAAKNSQPRSSICRQMRRPALPPPRSPPHQIPIDSRHPAEPPRVPSLKAFGHRPSAPADRLSTGRCPKPYTSPDAEAICGERRLCAPKADNAGLSSKNGRRVCPGD
jgi:hypothetical protein